MSKHTQAAQVNKPDKKNTPTKPAPISQQPAGEFSELAPLMDSRASGRLGDPRLQTAQRQMLARRLGQVHGNRQLQQLISKYAQPPVQRREAPGNVQPQEATETESGPTAEEKAAAQAAAQAAEQQAAQVVTQGKEQANTLKTEQATSKKTGQEAKQKTTESKTKAKESPPKGAFKEKTSATKKKKASPSPPPANGAEPQSIGQQVPMGANGAGPQAKAPASAEEDPAFQATIGKIKSAAQKQKKHAPADKKSAEAQAAAESPAAEIEGKAQAGQVGKMEQAETPPFDAAAFKAQLMERIAALAPKTAEQADNFKSSGKLNSVKGEMKGKVAEEKGAAEGPMKEKVEEAPDTGSVEPKPVTPLSPAEPGPEAGSVDATQAVPKPKGKSEIETPLKENSKKIDQQMAEADVTEEQLAKANEPEFQSALDAKKEAKTHAQSAPQAYRQAEQEQINQAKTEASDTAQQKLQGMHGDRADLLTQVQDQQSQTKTQDEQARQAVAQKIQGIYAETQTKVTNLLNGLDTKVETAFDQGAEKAKQSFESFVDAKMEAYKERRYGGWLGWARWVKDKVAGMPAEVNTIYQEGRQRYLAEMDGVIDKVVAIIGADLSQAKAEIANGKQRIQDYVNQLPAHLQDVGQQAAQDIQGKFDALEQSVNDKQSDLINTLANKYQENLQAIDARIEEMKAANRGLVDKALDAIGGVIKTILKLKDMLLGVLAQAASAVTTIIKDPIGFLGNLIGAVKQGLQSFVSNIGTHLKKGLMSWLFGAVAEAGIELPKSFDLKGILSLVAQVLGLTWQNIRTRAVKMLGERVVGFLESAFEIFQLIKEEGLGGLWKHIMGMLGSLKDTVMDAIKEMVITQVIKAGIQWLIGILGGPAGAFIKAAKAIYDIVMWFINNGSRVISLVQAVLKSITSIAAGAVGQAAKFIEESLAKAIPIVISFLASLLGLGDIANKIKNIIKRVQAPVNKVIDWVLKKAKSAAKKIGGKLGFGKDKQDKESKVKAGKAAIKTEEKKYAKNGEISQEDAKKVATSVKGQHPIFQSITVVDGGESWDYDYVIQRAKKKGAKKKGSGGDEHRGRLQVQGNDLRQELSWPWARTTPPTAQESLAGLRGLRAQLNASELALRDKAFEQAEGFITRAGQSGGVDAPVSLTFQNPNLPKKHKTARVDIEVRKGKAFV